METVRKAFVKLSRRYPPEHFPEKFKQIKNAFDRLSLNPSSINSLVKALASNPDAQSMATTLIEEAMQTKTGKLPNPELDVYSLECIFDTPIRRQRLRDALADIRDHGLEFKDPS